MSLITGKWIRCQQRTFLPMPAEDIKRVCSLATHSSKDLNFRNKNEDSDIDTLSQNEDSYNNNDDEGTYYHPITNNGYQSDGTQDTDEE
jgi:hypothetical protein